MCKTRASCDFLLLPPLQFFCFFQVMSQLRRSARLASVRARAAQSSSVPEPILLDDDDTNSLYSPPRDSPVCIECGFELESEDDARVFSCCSSPRHLRCLAPLAVEVHQKVRCHDCPSKFADRFQRPHLINGVECSRTPQLSDCTVCMEAMTVENSIQVPWIIRSHCLSHSIFLFLCGGLPFLQSVACRCT